MKQQWYVWGIMAVLFSMASCKKEDKPAIRKTPVTITTTLPAGIEEAVVRNMSISLKENNTGTVTTAPVVDNTVTVELAEGVYNIAIEGDVQYKTDGQEQQGKLKGYIESLRVTGAVAPQSVKLFLSGGSEGFVFQEIFFSGTETPQGNFYLGDRYFKIYNNSEDTLYADGLVIADSEFLTVEKNDYTPDIMQEAVAVGAIFKIPGNGTTYPVYPGKAIVIAETAINHLEFNTNSADLSKADFEIYHEDMDDVDNPSVANVSPVFGEMVLHNRGFKSFVLARFPVTDEQYLAEYKYDYTYDFVFEDFSFPMDGSSYKIPNEWVIDAVNLSVQSEFKWIVTAPSLDMGWTYSGQVDGDKQRFGNSVQRKEAGTGFNGRVILQDTNNSANDFTPQVKASLIQ